MKPYAVLLGILWAVSLFWAFMLATSAPHPYLVMKSLGDIVLLSLCLAGCIELAFGKCVVKFTRSHWRMVFNGTLILGAMHVMLKNFGEAMGVPSFVGEGGILQILLDFLPYVLFAIPVIILEHERKKAGEA